jgi:predicted PhzF superfamily epimerase YddE/YHI9
MPELHVLRVFVGDDGEGGNPLGVFLEGHGLEEDTFQAVAADLGFSETVFVADGLRGELRIFTPASELPLAGHPLVGTSWLLREEAVPADVLRPPAGEVPTWRDGDMTWIRADPQFAPPFERRRLGTPAEVDAHPGGGADELLEVWAWENEAAGVVRARVFPRPLGIFEDEATGAAALALGAELGRPLTIHQGVGSRIDVRPAEDGGLVEIGGRVERVETRDYALT